MLPTALLKPSRLSAPGRPYRPPTRSGRIVHFTTIEDESDYIHATVVKEALDQFALVFLLSPAIIIRGILQRKGVGAGILVEKAKPLRLAEFTAPPPVYPAPGTSASLPERPVELDYVPVLA